MNDDEYYEAGRHPVLPSEPPIRPNQIKGLKDLKPGTSIFLRDIHGSKIKAVVQNMPYHNKVGWWLTVKTEYDTKDISLADHCVISYQNESWNQINWIESIPE